MNIFNFILLQTLINFVNQYITELSIHDIKFFDKKGVWNNFIIHYSDINVVRLNHAYNTFDQNLKRSAGLINMGFNDKNITMLWRQVIMDYNFLNSLNLVNKSNNSMFLSMLYESDNTPNIKIWNI